MNQMNPNQNPSLNNDIINELQTQINSIKKVNDIQKEALDKLMGSIQLFSNEINNHKRINDMYKSKFNFYNQSYVNNINNQHQPFSNPLIGIDPFNNFQNNQPMNVFQFQNNQHIQETYNTLHLNQLQPQLQTQAQDLKDYHDRLSNQK